MANTYIYKVSSTSGTTVDTIPLFVLDSYKIEVINAMKNEVKEYRKHMLNIDRRYEGTKKSIRSRHYSRDRHRYYHLYKHRSY